MTNKMKIQYANEIAVIKNNFLNCIADGLKSVGTWFKKTTNTVTYLHVATKYIYVELFQETTKEGF